eukprot:4886897-Pyramimonas_sp.AAC.1
MRLRDNLLHLRRRMKAYYIGIGAGTKQHNKSTIGRISLETFQPPERQPNKARLRARAAETRHLVGPLPQLRGESLRFLGPRRQR